MAAVLVDLDDAIEYVNILYNSSSDTPTSSDEEYTVWKALINIAVDLWENEEGMLWKELFVKLADAATGDKTTAAGDYSYSVPTDFKFPASGYVWLGSGTSKTAFKIIKQEDLQLYENNSDNWCYFLMDTTPTLEFNPNCNIQGSETISYNYYKKATKLATGTDTFEMADPMFAVFYTLSELKKEEGDDLSLSIAQQKMEGMKTKNVLPSWYQEDTFEVKTRSGFGV